MLPIQIVSTSRGVTASDALAFPLLNQLASMRALGLNTTAAENQIMPLLQVQQSLMASSLLQMLEILTGLLKNSAVSSGSAPSAVASSSATPGGASSADSAPSVGGKDMGNGWISPLDNYTVTSGFGPRKPPTAASGSNHKGLDMAAPMNTPVRAAKAGTVTLSRDDSGGYGKWIEVKHADGSRTRYPHLNSRGVQVGEQVAAGQVIGKVGSTGNSTGPHLHFEIIDPSGRNIDPATVLKK